MKEKIRKGERVLPRPGVNCCGFGEREIRRRGRKESEGTKEGTYSTVKAAEGVIRVMKERSEGRGE